MVILSLIYTIHLLNYKKQALFMFVFILGNKVASSYNSYMRTKGVSANNKELIAYSLVLFNGKKNN